MAALYTDEDFPVEVAEQLQLLGHDVLTVFDDQRGGLKIDDVDVLQRAIDLGRAILTHDRWHFSRLHRQNPNHFGIIICTRDQDNSALTTRIDSELAMYPDLSGQLVRVYRPNTPSQSTP